MGQFSTEIIPLTGSHLNGNQHIQEMVLPPSKNLAHPGQIQASYAKPGNNLI